jgi:CheY-like chemotaxis protein
VDIEMPISKYYGGHGLEVMRAMKKKYGKRAKAAFYATANKKGQAPKISKKHERNLRRGYA